MTTKRTHKDHDWCVLPDGHEGKCLADWEKKHVEHQKSFKNYRGRRYNACTAASELRNVIKNLGVEDGSQLPQPDRPFNPIPPEPIKAELEKMVDSLLTILLLFNDGPMR